MAARVFGGISRSRSGPTLDLTFARCDTAVDPRIAVSRASTGWRINSAGVFVPVTAGLPRMEVDAATLVGKGLLIEEQRANKNTNYNVAPDGALTNLFKSGDAAATLTEVSDSAALIAAGLGTIGNGKAFRLNNSAGSTAAYVAPLGTVGNLNAHTCSAYIRGGTGYIGQPSGVGGNTFGASASYVKRVAANWVPAFTTTAFLIRADAGQDVFFIFNQLQEGGFATSPVVVAGAAATRAADGAVLSGAAFTHIYNQARGTVFVRFSDAPTDQARPLVVLRESDANNRIQITTGNTAVVSGGVVQAIVGNGVNKAAGSIAFTYEAGSFQAVTDGGAASTAASGSLPTSIASMTLGYFDFGGAERANACIARVVYWPDVLGMRELQSLHSTVL